MMSATARQIRSFGFLRSICLAVLAGCSAQREEGQPFVHKAAPGRHPTYLADLDLIERPMTRSAVFGVPQTLLSRSLSTAEDPSRSAVEAFMQLCLPLVMKSTDPGPDISLSVLDPVQKNLAPGHFRYHAGGRDFCVPHHDEDENDPAALMGALATALPEFTHDMTYLPRTPVWCGGGIEVIHEPPPSDLEVSYLDRSAGPDKTTSQCWTTAQAARYSTVVALLQETLAAAGTGFQPDPLVADGSVLHQTTFVTTTDGITRTILVSGPKWSRLNGPRVELQSFVGRFTAN